MNPTIVKLNLVKFGKFRDFEIEVKNGLNVIFGVNEAGKSTINFFIKAMLYGMSSRKKAGESIKERERAIPWDEKCAEGILTVKLGKQIIEIRRTFGKTAKGDKTEVCDGVTGERIEDIKEETIGEWLFRISQTVFEKTLWVEQGSVYMGGSEEELVKKIINLSSGGDENASAGEAIKKLTEMRKEIKAKTKNSTAEKLDILEQRLENCIREKYELSTNLAQEQTTTDRKIKAEEELLDTEMKIAEYEKAYNESIEYEKSLAEIEVYKKICDCDVKIQDIHNSDEYKKGSKLTRDITQNVKRAQERISTLERELLLEEERPLPENKKTSYIPVILGGIFGILGIIGIVLSVMTATKFSMIIMSLILCVISALSVAFGVKKIEGSVKQSIEIEKAKGQAEIKKNNISGEINALKADADRIFKEYDVEDSTELERLYLNMQVLYEKLKGIQGLKDELCEKYNLDELKEKALKFINMDVTPSDDINKELKELREKHLNIISDIKSLEGKMAYQTSEHRIPADIDTEISAIRAEMKILERKLLVIDTAIENITASAEEWRTTVAPKLNSAVNEIMNFFTGGKYKEIRVSDEFSMRVLAGNNLYDAEFLSKGTYEQLYLALRIALAKNEDIESPLFLDDILTVYDDTRVEAVLKYLSEVNKGCVFLFTCHNFVKEKAKAFDANIINL